MIIYLLRFALCLPFLFLGCSGNKETSEIDVSAEIDSLMLATQKFGVEGMTCPGCENTVNYVLKELNGVTDVYSSYEEKYTIITYDTTLVKTARIEEAIVSKGYKFLGLYPGISEDQKDEQTFIDKIQE